MEVCARRQDGTSKAIRSLVHWKDKPDHVFTGCDDGTVKVGTSYVAEFRYVQHCTRFFQHRVLYIALNSK